MIKHHCICVLKLVNYWIQNIECESYKFYCSINIPFQSGNEHSAKLLIDNGANANIKQDDGLTPFQCAAETGKLFSIFITSLNARKKTFQLNFEHFFLG